MQIPGLRDRSPHWLDRLAALWPDRIALVEPDSGGRYTYTMLRERARHVAAALQSLGVSKGDRVTSLMGNGVEQIDFFFACGYLGAIYVPLNWRLSEREVREMVADTAPHVVLADAEFSATARAVAPEAIHIAMADYGHLLAAPDDLVPAEVCMDDPWLILFTGGTTGTPKGAVLTHGSITWNAVNTAVSWGLSESDIGPSFTPMFHTGGWNVFTLPLLLLGGRVIQPRRFDPAGVLRILDEEHPTVLFMVPTMFGLVADAPGFEDVDTSSLKWAISGGAPLPAPVYERWKGKVRLFKQGYGLTEVGPNNFATPDQDADRKRGTVGRLTYFASARIVDSDGENVSDGTPGELLLAGPHMCAGYWRRPEETEAAMGNGWFRTGDIARRDAEGYYYIIDRKKDMIITGGENVYPIEVESVLYMHPAVREAAVVGIPDSVWGEAICAVLSLKPEREADEEELRSHTRANLARYKVPKRFVIVQDVPKSAAGKILRAEARRMVMTQ